VTRDRGGAFERFSRAVDGPLTVLALAMIPLIVLPVVLDLSPAVEGAFLAVDYLIWAVFAAEYAIKLYLAPNRRRFVTSHLLDLVIVLVPMLRPCECSAQYGCCGWPASPRSRPRASATPGGSCATAG
jgi:voltage-gated potassium channel